MRRDAIPRFMGLLGISSAHLLLHIVPCLLVLHTLHPAPPSHPPPSHVLRLLPSLDRPLVAVNKSLASLPSSPPPLKSPPPVAPTGVHVGAKSKSSSDAIASPSVAPSLPVSPATIQDHVSLASRLVWLLRALPALAGRTHCMLVVFSTLGDEIKSFIFPADGRSCIFGIEGAMAFGIL